MGGRGRGAQPPNQGAYFVALAGVMLLLLMLCCYCLYFFIKKIREVTREESQTQTLTSSSKPSPSYPVQPGKPPPAVVRDGATAMAKLCSQVPPGKGGAVFPTSTSPQAVQANK